jgi:hypothetical protein
MGADARGRKLLREGQNGIGFQNGYSRGQALDLGSGLGTMGFEEGSDFLPQLGIAPGDAPR